MIPCTKYTPPIYDWKDACRILRGRIETARKRLGVHGDVNKHSRITNASYTHPDYDADYNYWEECGRVAATIFYWPNKMCNEAQWAAIEEDVIKSFPRGHNVYEGQFESVEIKFIKSKYAI